jgi:hypothetical protein
VWVFALTTALITGVIVQRIASLYFKSTLRLLLAEAAFLVMTILAIPARFIPRQNRTVTRFYKLYFLQYFEEEGKDQLWVLQANSERLGLV